MPLTPFQKKLAVLLSANRTETSYLAGGAAIHIEPQSMRYSNDLDYFHDTPELVARAYAADSELLRKNGYSVEVDITQPGYVRARIAKGENETKVEWAHETAWRFMPLIEHPTSGFQLHEVDLAINKVLALAGRSEARDFVDMMALVENVLPLGALCWAAAGKDPGFTPQSLLELLKRKGRYQREEIERLHLAKPFDLVERKERWLRHLEDAERFIASRPASELGCLYVDSKSKRLVEPGDGAGSKVRCHYGRPGGVLPQFV